MRRLVFPLLALLLAACRATPDALPTAAPTLPPPPSALTLGDPVSGTLTLERRIARWQFIGRPDLPVLADVTGGDITLTLLNPDGSELAAGDALDVTLTQAGPHIVRVQLTSGEEADYTLTVAEKIIATPTPTATPTSTPTPDPFLDLTTTTRAQLTPGEGLFGAFNTPDEEHLYTFHATADTFVRVRMDGTSGAVDPVLTLYGPGGTAIAVDDNGGGGLAALLNGIRLPLDGVYGVLATSEGGAGGYELQLTTATAPFPVTPDGADVALFTPTPPVILTPTAIPGVNGNQLTDHIPVSGALGRPGAVDRYTVQANIGDVFTVAARPTGGGLQPILEMTSPSGAVVARGETPGFGGEVLVHSFEATTTGAYVVFVSGGGETTGRYELSYGRGITHSTVRLAETVPDRTYEATMNREAVRHDWYLRLNAGDTINAAAASADGVFDPVLELINPNGGRILRDDNGGGGRDAQLFSVRVPESGLYRLRVTAVDPTTTGAYTLAWSYLEAVPTPTPPLRTAPLFTVDDTITPDEPRTYPLQGYTGEQVVIEVEAEAGAGLDTLVELVTAEGVVFATDDDSGGNLNPRLVTELPANGVYQVRVSVYNDGNNTGGPFVLRVRRGY